MQKQRFTFKDIKKKKLQYLEVEKKKIKDMPKPGCLRAIHFKKSYIKNSTLIYYLGRKIYIHGTKMQIENTSLTIPENK